VDKMSSDDETNEKNILELFDPFFHPPFQQQQQQQDTTVAK